MPLMLRATVFAGSYWALLRKHHPGMRAVAADTLRRMRTREASSVLSALDRMPADAWWPFGNYFIAPTAMVREYTRFAAEFINAFQEQHVGGDGRVTCPFSTAELNVTPRWQERCTGYLTERLLHWWSVGTNVTLRFTVSDKEVRYRAGCAAGRVHCKGRQRRAQL